MSIEGIQWLNQINLWKILACVVCVELNGGCLPDAIFLK